MRCESERDRDLGETLVQFAFAHLIEVAGSTSVELHNQAETTILLFVPS